MSSHYFDAAFKELMYWEGGARFHINKGDLGGATKYGISLRFLQNLPLEVSDIDRDGHVTKEDINALTEKQAKAFYRKHFWLHYQLNAFENEQVGIKLLNIFVNMRGRVAGRVAQRAIACCGVTKIKEDGYLGPISQSLINELTCSPDLLAMYLAAIRSQQEAVYRLIAAKNPTQNRFLSGWIRRARDRK